MTYLWVQLAPLDLLPRLETENEPINAHEMKGQLERAARLMAFRAAIEAIRQSSSALLESRRRRSLGQYFTPLPTAEAMGRLAQINRREVNVLDPAAGTGTLLAGWLIAVLESDKRPLSISVSVCEYDPLLWPALRTTLRRCAALARVYGIPLRWKLLRGDFIKLAGDRALSTAAAKWREEFDIVLMNPPYRRLRSRSRYMRRLSAAQVLVPNLYAAFAWLGLATLRPGGLLVALTPRSFANGTTFERYRKHLLARATIEHVHLHSDRGVVFRDSAVVQETVIVALRRPPSLARTVVVSAGADDSVKPSFSHRIGLDELVFPGDATKTLHFPSPQDRKLTHVMRDLPETLESLGLRISTGRVVDFRVPRHLRRHPSRKTVPLVRPNHFFQGDVVWPAVASPQMDSIVVAHRTRRLLLPVETYVLVKRFSSTEESRRVSAALFVANNVPHELVGFENRLNYIYAENGPLARELAAGMVAYLNSPFVDRYFRRFSGHTQVNASDIESLRFPSTSTLCGWGLGVADRTARRVLSH